MKGSVLFAMGKKLVKTVATTGLEGISYALDKGAELADDAQEWVESFDTKDTSGRDARKKKRQDNGMID